MGQQRVNLGGQAANLIESLQRSVFVISTHLSVGTPDLYNKHRLQNQLLSPHFPLVNALAIPTETRYFLERFLKFITHLISYLSPPPPDFSKISVNDNNVVLSALSEIMPTYSWGKLQLRKVPASSRLT